MILGRLFSRRVFIALTDVFHFILGFITPISGYWLFLLVGNPMLITLAPIAIAVAFIVYQNMDDDPAEEKLGDLLEYALGVIMYYAVFNI
jgi:hypothetical protein